MSEKRRVIWGNGYCVQLNDNGTLTTEYCREFSREATLELYHAMQKLFETAISQESEAENEHTITAR